MAQPPSPPTKPIGRRLFLGAVGTAAAGATLGGPGLGWAAAAPAPAGITVWRLNADWGYPVGPKSRSRCRCRACHLHAANKLYATEAEAVAGRIHPCCICQTEAFTVAVDTDDLFADVAADGSVDRRNPAVAAVLAAAPLGASTDPTEYSPTALSTDSDPSAQSSVLALTGSRPGSLAMIGGTALVGGAALVALGQRRQRIEAAENQPTDRS